MRATNISDEENGSLFQVKFKMKALCSPEILVKLSTSQCTSLMH